MTLFDLVPLIPAGLFVLGTYNFSDGANTFIKSTFLGYKKLVFYGGQYEFNEPFYAAAKIDEFGNFLTPVYRYPSTKTGNVKIRENGTAHYCGEYKWKVCS